MKPTTEYWRCPHCNARVAVSLRVPTCPECNGKMVPDRDAELREYERMMTSNSDLPPAA